jgi:hypothetical protein
LSLLKLKRRNSFNSNVQIPFHSMKNFTPLWRIANNLPGRKNSDLSLASRAMTFKISAFSLSKN